MPRPERPLDSDDDELLGFAADLRLLREKAGKPTYRELSKVAHYSVTVLSEAASGRKLPSLAVTTAYVHACGGDVEQWRRRWHEVADGAKPADPEREPPYLGLGAFQTEDSGRFFGREKLVGQLLEKNQRRHPLRGGFSQDGKLLATGHGDNEIRLIDTTTLREVAVLKGLGGIAYAAAFHGNRMAISHSDARIRLWDVTDPARPRLETTYTGHVWDVPGLAFSPDGTCLASGGNDTTVRLWEVGLDRAVGRLCARNPAPLTPEQWSAHFPDVPYRRFCR